VTTWKSTANPHYAKPLHIRIAFRVWLMWRNSPWLRAAVIAPPLGAAAWFLFTLILLAF
jgi:hypothetical protein